MSLAQVAGAHMAMEFGQFGFARLSANSPFQVDLIEAHALDHSFRSDTLNRDPIGFDFALLAHPFSQCNHLRL
jgi:hypothetical protein